MYPAKRKNALKIQFEFNESIAKSEQPDFSSRTLGTAEGSAIRFRIINPSTLVHGTMSVRKADLP